MYITKQLKEDLAIARSWESTRWTAINLCWHRLTWLLYGKRRGHQWLIPGPTSTSHPWGWCTPHKKEG